jgi:hypothetical protein
MQSFDDDVDRLRENFARESSTIITGLDQMIERVKKLEEFIRMLGPCQIKENSEFDVYIPLVDEDSPPKKRVRV